MLKVGITGIGFMGWIHYLAWKRIPDAKVVAICDTIPERLKGDWRKIKGNFGPQGEIVDLTGIAAYDKYEDLLADSNVDALDICLPPCAHSKAVIAGLQAGKNVFCEKPVALKVPDGNAMIQTAKETGKILCIGHVLPFFPAYRFIFDAKNSGKYGKLIGGDFRRIISDPVWLTNFYNMETSGGPMLDLHIHDAHFIRLLFGMPTRVSAVGRCRGEVPEYFSTQFSFADPSLTVTAASGCIMQQGRPFFAGYEVQFEKATVLFDTWSGKPLTVLNEDGSVETPEIPNVDDVGNFAFELTEVRDSFANNRNSSILDGSLAADALAICHKEIESILSGKPAAI
ncbi:MAG: Gfo/Idh/MocA family oxidoreductase [Planctomycetia bacterium]|nr:Gfo/Idh/MocA family oxidoreductase [Planctomycetia bacterium]